MLMISNLFLSSFCRPKTNKELNWIKTQERKYQTKDGGFYICRALESYRIVQPSLPIKVLPSSASELVQIFYTTQTFLWHSVVRSHRLPCLPYAFYFRTTKRQSLCSLSLTCLRHTSTHTRIDRHTMEPSPQRNSVVSFACVASRTPHSCISS